MTNLALDSLVFTEKATFARPGGEPVFQQLNWNVREGETWAVVGPVGSGKSTLGEVIQGKLRLTSGVIEWPFLDHLRKKGRPISWAGEVIHRVSFKEDSWLFSFSRHYYQQRFNFIEPQDDLSLESYLRSGTGVQDDIIRDVAHQLGIEPLLPLSFIKLSHGQGRRARLARALLLRPEWLILDEPFVGLDVAGRQDVGSLLEALVRKGRRILLITRRETLPEWVTHVLELDRLAISRMGPRSEFNVKITETKQTFSQPTIAAAPSNSKRIIELQNVHVTYGNSTVLNKVTWTVRAGERWAVLGPNGSGKTTLLSLICGDHPQAYSNDIWLFGQKRGSGESIWEIKKHIGLVSPEMHLYFSEPLNAMETAATGFFDVLAFRPTTPIQDAIVRELFDYFEISSLLKRPFRKLSTGEQRLVLLIRALVKNPPVLILDEPFQGLDTRLVDRMREWIDKKLRSDQTLIFVSHYAEEIPQTVTRRLRLENGQVIGQD